MRTVTHTRNPGESSVYNFNIVFEEPPAPAAREELGLAAWLPVARRLQSSSRYGYHIVIK